uniref:Uncharacterized protein n=1 Tax=Anguilla anguilla TaxID=7936 RepID=A0A0E9RD51_ANGAN
MKISYLSPILWSALDFKQSV